MAGAPRTQSAAWAASGWGSDRGRPVSPGWQIAVDGALDRLFETGGSPWVALRREGDATSHAVAAPTTNACDVALVFATAGFHGDYARIIERVGAELGAAHVVGCSAAYGIAGGREIGRAHV